MYKFDKVVLVVGANGFVGYHLLKKMVQLGYKIIAVDYRVDHLEEFSANKQLEIYKVDVASDIGFLRNKKIDVVLNLASIGHGNLISKKNEIDFSPIYNNVKVAENILKLLSYDGIRQYVQISSAAVYGNLNCAGNENMYLTPLSPYAISKVAMEYIGDLFGQLNDIDVVSLRIYNIYGYNKFAKENASNLIHNLVSFALANRNAIVYGDLSYKRDYIYIDDVVDALVFCVEKELAGGVYNLGTGSAYSVEELWQYICQQMESGGKLVSLRRNYYNVLKYSCADTSKLSNCGFNCNVSIEEGIGRIADLLRAEKRLGQ